MAKKLPNQIARERLEKRARKIRIQSGEKGLGRLTDAEKKTPSQKRSENGRKRLENRARR